ncbi:hypothetical protein B0H34DRAFT_312521 [Crassisporium funariophilum]|nr:hypothetical protein B0H34DRAFT_312521 [Crassisporium funariophilum]
MLETHRGFSVMRPLITRRQFISSACLDDVVINEGLYGWNVRYYLAAMQRANLHSCCTLAVAYQNILPGHEILLHVYEGIHELLLSREEVGL